MRSSVVVGLTAQVAVLTALGASAPVGAVGWVIGLGCGAILNAAVALGLDRAGAVGPGPADLVTLARGVIACGLAALTADTLLHHPVARVVVPITVVALLLDAVDGWLARRTGTASAFGKRFDGEVDAFLILVLSVYVAPTVGAWVLAAGLLRYGFAVAGWVLPWMRAQLTYRYWRKVVTATLGIVLTAAVADVLPRPLTVGALLLGLALAAESFGRDVWWLWRHRPRPEGQGDAEPVVRSVLADTGSR
ncbi:MAG TPA: CDP-alcohol phosphatidyltransferase family protein [Intrasporangium sp.]|uniref:CDP-alcohol phosphatidyltransferase family protein n=1 Tax=Intrasporangium sp. TaxID=1925024 RepID=UPI002D78E23C|nr:CDP-alcohol phosphatidyltransferase family protein [Intrasporangium sp.]HET7400111.1 CDP-alcohol phosphatidyltransferase family protein [Intrasporangium sp.]